MKILVEVISEVLGWLIASAFLYWGIRLVREKSTFAAALVITLLSSMVGAVFGIFAGFWGALAGWITMLVLLKKMTTVEDVWPTAVLITVVVWLLKILVVFALAALAGLLLGAAAVAAA